jgi:AraC family transcriptional regulator
MGIEQLVWQREATELAEREIQSRTELMRLGVGLVEDVRSGAPARWRGPEGFSPDFQVCFPYRGMLVWHVRGDEVVGDANQVLFVTAGEDCRISNPVPGGYRELIITPEPWILPDIVSGIPLPGHPLFRSRARRVQPSLQSLRARFIAWARGDGDDDELAAEELVLALLRAALEADAPREEVGSSTRRLIRQTKEYLEAELASPIRLADAGRAVGASPAYLTHLFRSVEGISLHQYLIQLRLARALVELPHADDLTALALEIGFSSHSHFTAAFRRAFGATPSEFRQTSRVRLRPSHVIRESTSALNRPRRAL